VPRGNVEVVRALIAQWNAGDRDLERSSAYVDPTIELESPISSLVGEPYRGYAGIEQWMCDLDEQFAEWVITVHDIRQVGESVVAIVAVSGRGRASGAPLEFDSASVFEFGSDHRVTRAHIYPDVREALKAVGLER
jgi:ketosteroid isomerase-like protein